MNSALTAARWVWLTPTTVDTRPVSTRRTGEPFHMDDGLHLSLAGQQALTIAVVDTLTDQP
jgi:hypothetical protein